MIFDLFHSISDGVVDGKSLGTKNVLTHFIEQVRLAESLGVDTVWCAESHFSSETQKKTPHATIQSYEGEVGINCDSFQLLHWIYSNTKKINVGTGIHNIVGGSGGPIASADRVNALAVMNELFWEPKRILRIGVASGRFPYQNVPFGIVPRNETEKVFWPVIQRFIFLEALEIFLRLLRYEELHSKDITSYAIDSEKMAQKYLKNPLSSKYNYPIHIESRWKFETLRLVPSVTTENLKIILGSSDPEALKLAYGLWDIDLFNLSFTPPEMIQETHQKLFSWAEASGRVWHRSRMPRTVLVFIDPVRKKAKELADRVLDSYINAMKGTAKVPDKEVLLRRALVGDASEIREQLSPQNPRGFHPDDRLMLWFEFNQLDHESIRNQMIYFFENIHAF